MAWLLRTLTVALPVAWHASATLTRDSFLRLSLLEDENGKNGEGADGEMLNPIMLPNGHSITKAVYLPDADFDWSVYMLGIWEGKQEVTTQILTIENPKDKREQISQERAERAAETQKKVWKRDSGATAEIIDTGMTGYRRFKFFWIVMADTGKSRTNVFRALSMPEFKALPKKNKVDLLVQLASNLKQLESAGVLHNAISTTTVFLDRQYSGQWKILFMDFGMATEHGKCPDRPWYEEPEFMPSPGKAARYSMPGP